MKSEEGEFCEKGSDQAILIKAIEIGLSIYFDDRVERSRLTSLETFTVGSFESESVVGFLPSESNSTAGEGEGSVANLKRRTLEPLERV